MRRVGLTAWLLTACSASAPDFDGALAPIVLSRCPEGFTATPGAGCAPILPAADCPAGTAPRIGFEDCQPVGVRQCAAGFEPDPSGWGCAAVADLGCTGATMPVLGQRTCQPVGDCAKAWPPAGATHFVDPMGPVDATHFRSIQQAIVAQTAPGAVIAVAAGTYTEALQPLQPMTIVGKCAAEVIVQSPGINNSGLRLRTVAVTLEGVTLSGHYTGVAIDTRGTLTLRECVLDANRELGATVAQPGSQLIVERSLIRGSVSPNAAFGRGIQVQAGGQAVVRGSAVLANHAFGIFITDAASRAEVQDTIVAGTLTDAQGNYGLGIYADLGGTLQAVRAFVANNGDRSVTITSGVSTIQDSVILAGAAGLIAQDSASVTVSGSTIALTVLTGLGASGAGVTLTATDTVVRGNHGTSRDATAAGARFGARIVLRDTALVANEGMALQLAEGGQGEIETTLISGTVAGMSPGEPRAVEVGASCGTFTKVSVVGNVSLGMLGLNASCPLTLTRTLIAGTVPNARGRRGWGLSVQNTAAVVRQSFVNDNFEVGIFVYGAGATAMLEGTTIAKVRAPADGMVTAIGLLGMPGTRSTLTAATLRGSEGVGMLFNGAAASVFDTAVADNAIGMSAMGGSTIELVEAPPAVLGPTQVAVGASTLFVNNQTRVGSGDFPLPSPF